MGTVGCHSATRSLRCTGALLLVSTFVGIARSTQLTPGYTNDESTPKFVSLIDYTDATHDSHDLSRRAPDGVDALSNNDPQNRNVNAGETQNWIFPFDVINGPHGEQGVGFPHEEAGIDADGPIHRELKRQTEPEIPIWITINTCLQPTSNTTSTDDIPPQLELYWSTENDKPGPGAGDNQAQIDVEGGYGVIAINASTDIYVGVAAPNTTAFSGIWNYEVAASNDAPYHDWRNTSDLYFVDGDNHAALLVTPNLTTAAVGSEVYDQWMSLAPPYGMFAHNHKNRSVLGVSRSYCGLLNNAKIVANLQKVENQNTVSITNRGIGGLPKEQFYINPLDASSDYWGFLAMQGNSTASGNGVIGGGGKVFAPINFTTKAESNCALLYNLTFCSEVAYAVPSNPENFDPRTGVPKLAAVYDDYARSMYQNFNYSLQQIPCNTTASAQYSLARNCDDCARAYKQWLCAVTIPRCEDYGNTAGYLAPRNVAQKFTNGSDPSWFASQDAQQISLMTSVATNQSRNPQIIDEIVQPGPYKEVLPCIDLCYDLVQSCPAALGFGCPGGKYLNMSYGMRDPNPGTISCSWLGAAYFLGDASKSLSASVRLMSGVVVGVLTYLLG